MSLRIGECSDYLAELDQKYEVLSQKEMEMEKPEKYIKWTEVSKKLCGHSDTLRSNRIPYKHRRSVKKLMEVIREWIETVNKDKVN